MRPIADNARSRRVRRARYTVAVTIDLPGPAWSAIVASRIGRGGIVGTRATTAEEVFAFWFEENPQQKWFEKDQAFDAAIGERFGATLEAAKRGDLDHWSRTPHSAIALVIVLDQFSRNLFRDDPRAFEADPKALDLARSIRWRGWDRGLSPEKRLFCYLPFEHSERLDDQHRSVMLFSGTGNARWIEYAERHRDIIARFGRFPHRNACLGRASTADELAQEGA
jgi:uncharacterized protein (DUF924 family)